MPGRSLGDARTLFICVPRAFRARYNRVSTALSETPITARPQRSSDHPARSGSGASSAHTAGSPAHGRPPATPSCRGPGSWPTGVAGDIDDRRLGARPRSEDQPPDGSPPPVIAALVQGEGAQPDVTHGSDRGGPAPARPRVWTPRSDSQPIGQGIIPVDGQRNGGDDAASDRPRAPAIRAAAIIRFGRLGSP